MNEAAADQYAVADPGRDDASGGEQAHVAILRMLSRRRDHGRQRTAPVERSRPILRA